MNEIRRQLLNKYLDSNCTPDELQVIKAVLQEEGTEDLLHELMEERASTYEAVQTDNELCSKISSWETLVIQRIVDSSKNREKEIPSTLSNKRFDLFRYAAIWAGILLFSSLAVWQFKKAVLPQVTAFAYIESVNHQIYPVKYLLPDSSIVYLGKDGKIRYPEKFTGSNREVSLWGEAFFEVTPNRNKPFVVQTRHMQTRVLGTSFKIEAYENCPLVVSVATGKVGVSAATDGLSRELAMLTPGRKLTYNDVSGSQREADTDINSLKQWASGDLVFDEQPLRLVMLELQKRYGISARFNRTELADYKISGSFDKNENISSILTMLGVISNFRYELKDGTVDISR